MSGFGEALVPVLASVLAPGAGDELLGVQSAGGGTVAGPAGLIVVSGTMTWLWAVRSISHRCRGRMPGSGRWTSAPMRPPSFWCTPELVSCCWKTRLVSLYSSGMPR
ncbi:hypothetical protein Lesp01_08280 [Lentzea sp. NBRC 102530]|nr:hypothetical protein Lesp01_08280 [Lentzea sp. NBRC 102530]